MVLDVSANLRPHIFSHAGSMFLMALITSLCCLPVTSAITSFWAQKSEKTSITADLLNKNQYYEQNYYRGVFLYFTCIFQLFSDFEYSPLSWSTLRNYKIISKRHHSLSDYFSLKNVIQLSEALLP